MQAEKLEFNFSNPAFIEGVNDGNLYSNETAINEAKENQEGHPTKLVKRNDGLGYNVYCVIPEETKIALRQGK